VIDRSDPQQMHGYAHANNNPTTFSDPDGGSTAEDRTALRVTWTNRRALEDIFEEPIGEFDDETDPMVRAAGRTTTR
jgi:hypothetical protein